MKRAKSVVPKKSIDTNKISKKRAKRLIEKVCPHLIKAPRLRNIVRRAIRKTKTKEFANKLDAVFVLVGTLQDLIEQSTAEYPHPEIRRKQMSGAIAKNISDTSSLLATAWKKLLTLT